MSLDETQSSREPSKPPDPERTPRSHRTLATGYVPARTPSPNDSIRSAPSRRTGSSTHASKPYERQHIQPTRRIADLTQTKRSQRDTFHKSTSAKLTTANANQSDAEADISDMDSDMDVEPPANQIIELIELLASKLQESILKSALPSNLAEQVSDQGHMLTEMLRGLGVGTAVSSTSGVEMILMSQISAIHDSIVNDKKANEKRLDRIEEALRNSNGGKTSQAPSPAPNWADDSYAAQAARPTPRPHPKPKPTSTPTTTSKRDAERETRFVAYFNGSVEPKDRREPHETVHQMNEHIKELFPKCSNTKVATAKWNASGNLVLSVLPGQKAQALEEIFPFFYPFYTKTDKIPQDTRLDIAWNKIIVDGVPTGSTWTNRGGLGTRPHKSDELAMEAKAYNPLLADTTFALPPRFLVPPADLVGKAESSIVFATYNKETANDIISLGYIVMYGKRCKVRKYQDRSPTRPQCHKCHRFGHMSERCTYQRRCGLCGDPHTETEHTLKCTVCRDDASVKGVDFTLDSLMEGSIPMCPHNLKCVNCEEKSLPSEHRADNRQCPERTRQMGSVRDNNRAPGAGMVSSSSSSRKKKKPTKSLMKAPSQPAALPVSNSFAAIEPVDTDIDADSNMGGLHD
ncbi:protein [Lentinula edodes]|uniref:Protein n=1 Tax=Lentinula edodes TaxID=5353 RepID=A0A1Q3EFI0_LENED|nr:protein [Lentinula edodes]